MRPHAVCCAGPQRLPACALCPVSGGLMRRTTCGRWVHAACALWTPGMWINADSGLVEGLAKLPKVYISLWDLYGICHQHLLLGVLSSYICLMSPCSWQADFITVWRCASHCQSTCLRCPDITGCC